jgi:hypothetical protein
MSGRDVQLCGPAVARVLPNRIGCRSVELCCRTVPAFRRRASRSRVTSACWLRTVPVHYRNRPGVVMGRFGALM